jgi:SAM-dependent methyltransferase
MTNPDWNQFAKLGVLQAVIDPLDTGGFKNRLIDRIQWICIKNRLCPPQQLLDFGCGSGRFAARLATLGVRYFGIDFSREMLRTACRTNLALGMKFVQFDGQKLPFASAAFDVCLTTGVLQYLINGPDISKILAELRRVLRPGGRLILIEQASLSNQSSGTVSRAATALDYCSALSPFFELKSVQRIRSCQFSSLSSFSMRLARFSPWGYRWFLGPLAKMEIRRAQRATDSYFLGIQYYDIMIEALTY